MSCLASPIWVGWAKIHTKTLLEQLVSFDGEVLLPFVVDEVVPLQYIAGVDEDGDDVYEQHPYLSAVLVDYKHWGVMDSRNGKMVLPAIYSDVDLVSKDLIMAEVDGNEENNILFTVAGKRVE